MSTAATSHRAGSTEEPGSSGDTVRPPGWRRVAVVSTIVVLTALSLVWRLWLVRDAQWLTVRIDEDGYLLVARVLAGGPGGVTSENPLFRHVGYPMLITPVYWFTRDPAEVYHGVQVINAVINSLTLPLAYLVSRRVFGLARVLSVATAATAASIPAVVFYGGFALTDAVLAPLFAGWILALHNAVTNPDRARAVWSARLAGALVGAAWLIHVRSIVILAVHVLVFTVLALRRRIPRGVATASWLGIVAAILVDLILRAIIGDAIALSGESPSGTLRTRLLTPFGLVHTVNWAVGQVWYLTISTLGLAAVAGVATVYWLRRRGPGSTGRTVFLIALSAVTIGIAVFSAATLPDGDRINLYAYARYIAFTAPLWMIVAVAALAQLVRRGAADEPGTAPRPVPVARLIVWAAVLLVASTHLVVSYSRRLRGGGFLAFDAPEASALTFSWDRLRLAAATAVVLVTLAGLTLLLARSRTRLLGLGVVLVASVAAMPAITAHAAQPMSRGFMPSVSLTRDLGVTAADRVAMDNAITWWASANVQWEVTWAEVTRFDSTKAAPPADATIVVAPWRSPSHRRTWNGTRQGFHVIHQDQRSGTAVWRRN
jgi:hypothetical protein